MQWLCSGEMSGWAGFSEAELRRIQQKGECRQAGRVTAQWPLLTGSPPAEPPPAARGRRAAPAARSRQQIQREKALQMAAERSPGAGAGAASLSLPAGQQQLSGPAEPPAELHPGQNPRAPAEVEQQPGEKPRGPAEEEQQPGEKPLGPAEEEQQETVKELDRQEAQVSVCLGVL